MGGDPPPQTSTTTVQQQYSPEEAAARKDLFDIGKGIYGRTSEAIATGGYPGAAPVPFSADTRQAQDMLRTVAAGPGADVGNQAAGALKFGLGDVLYPGSNPALEAGIASATRPVTQAFTDPGGVLSKIRTDFVGSNSGGQGSREGVAGGIAARSYLDTIGDISTKMTFDNYSKGLDFMKSSMAFAPNLYNLMTQPALTIGAVGQQTEGMDQATANYEAAQRQWGLTGEWQALQPYANLIMGVSNPTTVTTGTAPGARANPMAPIGMAMMGAQMGSMIPGIGTAVGAGAGLLAGLLS